MKTKNENIITSLSFPLFVFDSLGFALSLSFSANQPKIWTVKRSDMKGFEVEGEGYVEIRETEGWDGLAMEEGDGWDRLAMEEGEGWDRLAMKGEGWDRASEMEADIRWVEIRV